LPLAILKRSVFFLAVVLGSARVWKLVTVLFRQRVLGGGILIKFALFDRLFSSCRTSSLRSVVERRVGIVGIVGVVVVGVYRA
jgi:hypothetical protein